MKKLARQELLDLIAAYCMGNISATDAKRLESTLDDTKWLVEPPTMSTTGSTRLILFEIRLIPSSGDSPVVAAAGRGGNHAR